MQIGRADMEALVLLHPSQLKQTTRPSQHKNTFKPCESARHRTNLLQPVWWLEVGGPRGTEQPSLAVEGHKYTKLPRTATSVCWPPGHVICCKLRLGWRA